MNIHYGLIAIATVVATMTGPASAQTPGERASAPRAVTVIGCIERESDYRRAHDAGRGGPFGFGLGRGDEYVLVNAVAITLGQQPPADATADCSSASAAGAAYELERAREGELEPYVDRRVQLSGMVEAAEIDPATGRPTGGFDPLGGDLELFELAVASFREPSMPERAEAPPARDVAPGTVVRNEPAPGPRPPVAAREPSPVGTAGVEETLQQPVQELPRTASPLPLAGLLTLGSLGGALIVRSLRRR